MPLHLYTLYLYPYVLSPQFLVLGVRLTNLNLRTKDCAARLDYEGTMHVG